MTLDHDHVRHLPQIVGSDPDEQLPTPHTWVRVRGVADGYVVDEVEQALQQGVALRPGAGQSMRIREALMIRCSSSAANRQVQPTGIDDREPANVSVPVGRWRGALVGPFPAAPGPNPPCQFPGNGLSSDYCVSVLAGCRSWMLSWQDGQTIKVLRRILAISCAHIGCGRPGVARSESLDTWCTCTSDRCSHSSHRPLLRRASSSLPLRRPVPGRVHGQRGPLSSAV